MARARPIDGFDPAAPLDQALRVVVRARFAEVLEQWRPAHVEEDPEALHDLRVAVRRVRSVLWAFRGENAGRRWRGAERALGRVFSGTNALRDADVLAERVGRLAEAAPPEAAEGVAHAVARIDKARRRARAELRDALGPRRRAAAEKRVAALCEATEIVEAPAGAPPAAFGRWAPSRLAAVLGDAGALGEEVAVEPASTEKLHALRIRLKRIRYVAEVFEPDGPGPLAEAIDRLRAVQDALGEVRDLDVQMRFLLRVLRRAETGWLREAFRQAGARPDPAVLLDEVLREGEPPERDGLLWLLEQMAAAREAARRTAVTQLGDALAGARAALDGALGPFGGLDAAAPTSEPPVT
jgi:CHAD domain-containing protein